MRNLLALLRRFFGWFTGSTGIPNGAARPEADASDSSPPFGLELYRIAVDEYRFQVRLNWQRTQHWFTLNVAIPGAAIALLRITTDEGTYVLVGAIFACGMVACIVGIVAARTQHEYYQSARDHMVAVGQDLGLPHVLNTTLGMKGGTKTWLQKLTRVTSLYAVLLAMLGLLDLGGVVYSVREASQIRGPVASQPKGTKANQSGTDRKGGTRATTPATVLPSTSTTTKPQP